MNFDEHRRLNMRDDNILENEKIIAAIGDSMTMGWELMMMKHSHTICKNF